MKLTANPAWLSLPPNRGKGSGAKFLRIMKLTTIIILAACLHTSAKGVAQQTITFSGKEVSLESVFSAIKKQTNYRFFFNTDMLSNASKVTLEVKNAQVEQVMNMALKDQPLTFTIKGRTIFVMKKQEEEKKSTQIERTGDPITVSGRVTDDQGQPLVGANVKVKGGNNGVTTDGQGRFTLNNVDPNASLEISFVGHDTQTLPVKGKTVFSVALGQKVGVLDETLVIAYGTTTRRFNTGNISTIKAGDIEKQPVLNPLLTLEGKVPGLTVVQNTGVPGGGITVRIQGQNSLRNGNDPLYVVDGVPIISQIPTTGLGSFILGNSGGQVGGRVEGVGNPLSYLNPGDIESIEVLKDADATSIYGSRAANGAILITTKKGKSGDTKVTLNARQGWGKVNNKFDMLDTRQYLDMRYEALRNDAISISPTRDYDLTLWDTTRYTDWQKELIGGTSEFTNVSSSVAGGNGLMQYLVTGTYQKETTVFPGSFSDEKASLHFNINSNSKKKFGFQFTGNYMIDDNELPQKDITESAVLFEPDAPEIYNVDGTLNWMPNASGTSTFNNPIAELSKIYKVKTYNLISNLNLTYKLLPDLILQSGIGYSNLRSDEFAGTPMVSIKPESRFNTERSAIYGNRDIKSWIIEPQINYSKSFLKGKLNILVGSTFQQTKSIGNQIVGSGYNSDAVLQDIRSATSIVAGPVSFINEYNYNAIFGRLNYSYDSKYILNLTARRDGSSRFGPKSRFHNFGSIGAAWVFSEYKFFQKNMPFLGFGKLRASLGNTGSDQIGDYAFLNLYTPTFLGVAYQGASGLSPSVVGPNNPYLEWEETKKISVGLELGLFSDRVLITSNFSRNRCSNQLINYPLPYVTGFSGVIKNLPATVQNTSFELSISTTNYKVKNFEWKSNLNITVPKNKLIAFENIETSTYSNSLIVGKSISITRAYHFLGVDPSKGTYLFEDINGNETASPTLTDRIVLINTLPKLYGGFQNSFVYNDFQLEVFFQFVKQVGLNNNHYLNRFPGQFRSGLSNQPTTVTDRWQKTGDITSIQKYSTTLFPGNAKGSDAAFSDASYIRLRNISLSWRVPNKWVRKMLLLYLQGQNILTITKFKGIDPESQAYNSLPPLRVLAIGVKVEL